MGFIDELTTMAKDFGEEIVKQAMLSVPFEYDYMGEDELTKLDNTANKVYYHQLPYGGLLVGSVFTVIGLYASITIANSLYGNVENANVNIVEGIPAYVLPLFPLIFVVIGLWVILRAIKGLRAGYKIALIISDELLYLVNKEGFVTKIERDSIKKAVLIESKEDDTVYYYLRLHYTHPNYEDVVNSTHQLSNIKGGPRKVVDDINQTYGLTTEARTNKVPSNTVTK